MKPAKQLEFSRFSPGAVHGGSVEAKTQERGSDAGEVTRTVSDSVERFVRV